MLNVIFGRENVPGKFILDTRVYFRRYSHLFDFNNPFIKSVIQGIDKAEVIAGGAIKDYRGLYLSVDKLSTGSKTLCSIYFDKEGKTFYGSMMGDNCAPYLMEIARNKNVTVFYEHFMPIPKQYFEEGIIQKDGKIIDREEFEDAYSYWCENMISVEEYLERKNGNKTF